ncbi:hypothetical protein DDF67_12675 [Caulobacter endophyticus]|uniref:Teneurin-like YD-shell domain-containing protein n=2 Tax=Caulobacter endophyticus TaxID=2172652 RepID=A0A2T9JYS4_9CAUL|nr:hypothetical protein DDF67_12675 [Caulobacter endophyticus]
MTSGANPAPAVITQLGLPGGYKIQYAYGAVSPQENYDQPERLLTVEYKNAAGALLDKTSYEYGDARFPTYVTAVKDKDDVVRWTASYDAEGRAISSSGPGGVDATSVAYGASGANYTRTVTNALGKQETYNFARSYTWMYDTKLVGTTGVASTNCPASATSLTYDANRFIASTTDEEGRLTTYVRDTAGRMTQVTEGSGTAAARTTNYTWNTTFNLPSKVIEPKLTTDYVYNTAGALTSLTQTDTSSYTVPYATNGRTRTWSYEWSATGQLLSIDGPLSGTVDKQSFTYNTNGFLQTATDAVGKVTTVTAWDWRGEPTTIVDPNGVSATLTYDVQGRVLTATMNPGAAQSHYQFTYSAMGDLTRMTLPGGGWLDYTYDAGRRLTKVENDRGETITLTPDALGAPTAMTVKASGGTITGQQSFAYDELGRLIRSVGAGSETTQFSYDKVSNEVGLVDARGKASSTAFDALDRVITKTDPESHSIRYAYEAGDGMVSHKDGRALETTMVVDGFGQTIMETSPDRGVRMYWYDAAGRMTKLIDGDGEETNFSFDGAGRPTGITVPGAAWETVSFGYDATAGGNKGQGRLTSITEESGSTAYVYDAQGRIIQDAKLIQGAAYTVGYAYDVNGKVTQVSLPSGRTVIYARASDGLVTGVSTKVSPTAASQALASSVSYQPFGPLKGLTYGNGLQLARTFDQNGWLSRTRVSATGVTRLDLSFDRNANGQLDGIADNAATGRSASFGYYDTGRLQYGVGPWGDHSYAYDGAGNRTDFRTVTGGNVAYQFALNSGTNNRVTEVQDTNGDVLRQLIYRDGGDLYEDAVTSGPVWQYYYNGRKRLVVVNKDGTDVSNYGYDFRGQRVWRSVFSPTSKTTHYVFDLQGHLLAEHDGNTGAVIKEYVWLDDAPLAVIDHSTGSAQIYYIHAGQLDEPQMMTDASKAKVWDAFVEPFGKAQVFGSTASLDLRLPGQWEQLESGFSQNWNRDYDPSLARYVQADPLGLAAGQSLYAYVDGRPTEYVDPDGLQRSLVRPLVPGSNPNMGPLTPYDLTDDDLLKMIGLPTSLERSVKKDRDKIRKDAEYKDYKRMCAPIMQRPDQDRCSYLGRRIKRSEQCIKMRISWDSRWGPGRHSISIIQEFVFQSRLKKEYNDNCTSNIKWCPIR